MSIQKINIWIVAVVALLVVACNSNDDDSLTIDDIPAEIRTDFETRHPAAENAEWEQEGDFWEAEFTENGVEVSIIYDLNLVWVRTEREIDVAALPAAVVTYVNDNFGGSTIAEAEAFESRDEGNGFIAEVDADGREFEVYFDENGSFLRQEEEVEDEDDDD